MIIQKLKKIIALIVSLGLMQMEGAILPLWAQENAPRTTLDDVEVGQDQVRIELSSSAKYVSFVTAHPPRLVVEILNTDFNLPTKAWTGKGQYLKRVRSAQFKKEPNPITRVVLDLAQLVEYKITPNENGLDVTLNPGTVSAEQASMPAAVSEESTEVEQPRPQPKKLSRAQMEEAEFRSMSTTASPELGEIAKKTSAAPAAADSPMSDAPAAKPASAQPVMTAVKRSRRDILSTLPREPISLDFDNTDVNDILRLMASKTNINIVAGPDVAGAMNLHLTKVPFHEAFNLILSMQGLVANQVGDNILRVMTPATLEKERGTTVGTTRVFQLNYSKASDVKAALDAVRTAEKRSGSTVVDDKNNALIVTETPEGQSAVERLLAQVDIRPRQVLIEAKLVEVKLSKELDLGIQWDYLQLERGKAFGKQGLTGIGTGFGLPDPYGLPLDRNGLYTPGTIPEQGNVGAGGRGTGVSLPADKIFGALTLGRITNNYMLSATLSAAASQGKVKVLSDPKIATLNGKAAEINITTQIPYVTSNVASTGVQTQTVSYTTTGIQLTVTPIINADGRITLNVAPRISQPSTIAATAGTTGAVAIDTRQATTNVLVKDGETIVIGGLITDTMTNSIAKVPLLGDIPVLGWLFKKKTIIRNRVELLIFVTPKIMPD